MQKSANLSTLRFELRALLALAIPVILSELGWVTMGIVDTIMVGRLGPAAIGAVGIASAAYYAPVLFGFGILLGLDTLVSQAWVDATLKSVISGLRRASISSSRMYPSPCWASLRCR